jgi:hypothetical protein
MRLKFLKLLFFCACCLATPYSAQTAAHHYFTSLIGMHVAGYQGWFSCPGDRTGLGWRHWFQGRPPAPPKLAIDMWPDTSGFDPDELCPTGLTLPSGQQAYLFSAENPKTVSRHFRWMKDYGIDVVAVQRFESDLINPNPLRHADIVLQNVIAAAKATGRGFFIMYDLSGSDPEMVRRVQEDWKRLTSDLNITKEPSYVHHKGKPVVALWGMGFGDRAITYQQSAALIQFFRSIKEPATLIGGVPTFWRTLERDSRADGEWSNIYRSFDVVSPWIVGRLKNEAEANIFVQETMTLDIKELKKIGIEYMPVLYPGMSWYNGQNGKLPINHIPRHCGNFYMTLARAELKLGVQMIYSAMFDEVNEGTAIFKVVARKTDVPVGVKLATLSDGNCKMEGDGYLKLAGSVTEALRIAK